MESSVGNTIVNPDPFLNIRVQRNDDFTSTNNRSCFKLIYIASGNGVISINDKKISVVPLTLLMLNEKDTVGVVNLSDVIAHSLYFTPSIVNSSLDIDSLHRDDIENQDVHSRADRAVFRAFLTDSIRKKVIYVTEIIGMQIMLLCDKIELELSSFESEFRAFGIRLHMSQLLYLLTKIEDADPLAIVEIPDVPKDIQKIVLYLHTYFNTQITLNSLAYEFRSNRTTISAVFKKTFKMTIMVYLTKIRLQAAAYLLRNTNLSVFEVASKTGFLDLSHFSRTFKKHWNYTPGDFRQSFGDEISTKIKENLHLTYNTYVSTQV